MFEGKNRQRQQSAYQRWNGIIVIGGQALLGMGLLVTLLMHRPLWATSPRTVRVSGIDLVWQQPFLDQLAPPAQVTPTVAITPASTVVNVGERLVVTVSNHGLDRPQFTLSIETTPGMRQPLTNPVFLPTAPQSQMFFSALSVIYRLTATRPGTITLLTSVYGKVEGIDSDGKPFSHFITTTARSQPIQVRIPSTWIHPFYLPVVSRPLPVMQPAPPDKYHFVEYWTHRVDSAACYGLCVDFPTYYLYTDTLQVYPPNPALTPNDLGFIGNGFSLDNECGGIGTGLTPFPSVPITLGGQVLRSIDNTGGIIVEREGMMVALAAGQTWETAPQVITSEGKGGATCVMTETQRITNYGLQNRDQIQYGQVQKRE